MEHCLAFEQASHQIHAEASPIMDRTLYEDVVLRFCICPKYQSRSWLTIESQFKKKWTLQSLDHAMKSGLHKIHYEKLRKIVINIDAPDDDWQDLGQIVCLYKKCADLASLLEHATKGLPDIDINLLESPPAKWGDSLNLRSQIDDESGLHYVHKFDDREEYGGSKGDFWDDAELVLHTFCRLRNARSANVYVPATTSGDYPYNEDLIALRIPEPFNTDLHSDDFDDQRVLDGLFIGLDHILDVLPGDTANMLRLDRFASWYSDESETESKYEKELERIYKTWTNHRVKERRLFSLYERYSGMVIYKFLLPEYAEFSELVHILNTTHVRTFEDADRGQDVDHIRDEKCYDGIPPFDSVQYRREFDDGFKHVNVRKRLDDFYKRIRTWMLIDEDISENRVLLTKDDPKS